MLLSIVIPFHNEEKTLPTVLDRAVGVALPADIRREVILVDDGSTDGSRAIAEAFAAGRAGMARVLALPRNQGKGAAMRAGLAAATGEVLLIQDADLEWDPADYPALLAPYADPRVMVVFGSRLLRADVRTIYPHYYAGGRLLSGFTNLLFGSHLTDQPTGFKTFRRAALAGLTLEADGFAFDAELTGKLLQAGHAIVEVPVRYTPRTFREGKKVRPKDGLIALWVLTRLRLRGRRRP
jgi:dolichol-phosphate mannosyltransferase